MKRISKIAALFIFGGLLTTACSDWNDHFDESAVSSQKVTVYNGDIASYLQTAGDAQQMAQLLQNAGVFTSTYPDKEYTFIVCDDQTFNAANISDNTKFAQYSVADMSVSPSMLQDGFGIYTRAGKNVWVYGSGETAKLDDYNIKKIVKTNNGYVYYIDGMPSIRQSVYEYLQSLGDDYSLFKEMVARYEIRDFDKEHSTILGVESDGRIKYDTVWITRNELMDRYNESGVAEWNMRDEEFVTTMFVPTNNQITTAINRALGCIPIWLNREATDADREKFEQWIVKACFVNKRLAEDKVNATAADFECVGGHQRIVDTQKDQIEYKSIDPAYWRPSVQTVNTSNKVNLSNGFAYFCTNLKIPNHIVIYRIKSRFYLLWNAMTQEQKDEYFRWTNFDTDSIEVANEAQGSFGSSNSPILEDPRYNDIYYNVLTAVPTMEARRDSLECSVEYDGLIYDEATNKVLECNLPAGEYYLRMGFKHSLLYSLSIAFNDSLLKKDMVMYAQGSNYHFDRGAASEIPHYGLGAIAYPEGYDVDYWQQYDEKAIAYDTDGYTVGIVQLKQNGNFRIKVSSRDISYLYDPANARTKNKNVTLLMMYHWCLRPTINNY